MREQRGGKRVGGEERGEKDGEGGGKERQKGGKGRKGETEKRGDGEGKGLGRREE